MNKELLEGYMIISHFDFSNKGNVHLNKKLSLLHHPLQSPQTPLNLFETNDFERK